VENQCCQTLVASCSSFVVTLTIILRIHPILMFFFVCDCRKKMAAAATTTTVTTTAPTPTTKIPEKSDTDDLKPVKKQITVKAMGQDGTSVEFKITTKTVLRKLIDAYTRKMGQDESNFRFLVRPLFTCVVSI
jgi:hypothetical protein